MDDLNEIEQALLDTLKRFPTGEAWFEEHWRPKFDRIRSMMISDKLKKAMYDVIFEMMECEPWHEPFDELQRMV